MAGESASAPELEPIRAPQEPDSHHALSLRFERYPKYLCELSRIQFVSEENGEEVASSNLVRVALVLAALWHGSAYSIRSSISSPLPKGGGDDGYRHSKKFTPPALPPRLKRPQHSHQDLTEEAENITEKSQPPGECHPSAEGRPDLENQRYCHYRLFYMSFPRTRESRGGTEVNYDAQ